MEWVVSALGNVSGSAVAGGESVSVSAGTSQGVSIVGGLTLTTQRGKFADSGDSFVFCHTRIDPAFENFELSATIRLIVDADQLDQQSGFGILVADTVVSPQKACMHRNHLLVGGFGRNHNLGARLVAGHRSQEAVELETARVVDESRVFDGSWGLGSDGLYQLALAKTDEGFVVSCNGQSCTVPGCDFLQVQDESSLYVGFAVARGVSAEVADIAFQTSPGKASHTPEGTIRNHVPDYPFSRELLEEAERREAPHVAFAGETLYVSPDGGADADGSLERPVALDTALRAAAPGTHIVLLDGVYKPTASLIVARHRNGTIDRPVVIEAEHPRKAVIDGALLGEGQPLFVLDADFWHVSGVVVCNSPLSGMTVCGNFNRIVNCEAYRNGDTGILVISRPGAERSDWPQRNMIKDCDSHGNCDMYRCNADGFGAKLRVGKGNVFYRCVAHHNIDDGFDLYSKSIYGPIEPVELDSCVAYRNGLAEAEGLVRTKTGGVGFKLGGENQVVAHEVWNCLAVGNVQRGFFSNSNPAGNYHFCTAACNGEEDGDDFKLSSSRAGQWVQEGIYCMGRSGRPAIPDCVVTRNADGSLVADASFAPKSGGGKRCGASLGIRKNVLVMVDSIGGGGAERVACRIATELSEKHDVTLMYFHEKGSETYPVGEGVELVRAHAPVFPTLPTPVGRRFSSLVTFLRRRAALKAVRKRNGIETTISFLSMPNLLNALCSGGRRIVCERNDPSQKSKSYRQKIALSCKRAEYAVFQTEKVRSMFPAAVQQKSCIIPNPVDVASRAVPQTEKKIVTVGRLHPQKNYALLLNAFAAFTASHPGYTLHLFGIGTMQGELQELAGALGIADSVVFEGFRGDVHEAISDAQMFVLSSDYEGMSNALIEAMMMGLPCISTACTGSDELITDGEDGLLVPVGDADALSSAMERLANDAALRAKLAFNARMRALDFTLEDVLRKWERIL